jgi:predicted negative regulator of RcsB-dependent stress response
VEIANDDPTVIEHLGDAYERVGEADDALRAYRDALGRSKEAVQSERLRGKISALELRGQAEGTGL